MKILINDYGIELESKQRQELPGDSLVVFEMDNGDRYRVRACDHTSGIEINLTRQKGSDQLRVLPQYSNQIIVE